MEVDEAREETENPAGSILVKNSVHNPLEDVGGDGHAAEDPQDGAAAASLHNSVPELADHDAGAPERGAAERAAARRVAAAARVAAEPAAGRGRRRGLTTPETMTTGGCWTTMVGGGAPAITTGIFPGWTACAVGAGCSMPTTVPERTTGSCWTTVPVATGWLPSAVYCSPCIVVRCLRSKTGEYGR